MTMLVVVTVTLSNQSLADCTDVVKTCDNLVLKQGDLIEILQQRNESLDHQIEELQDSLSSTRTSQGLWLLGGLSAGVILMTLLRAR